MNGLPQTPLADLLDALHAGASTRQSWELAIIGASIALGWLASRILSRRWRAALTGPAAHPSLGGLLRLVLPLATLALLAAGLLGLRATHLVAGFGDARLLRIAGALLGTLGGVRLLGYALQRAFAGQRWVLRLERWVAYLAALLALLYVTGLLADVVEWLRATPIPIGNTEVSLMAVVKGVATTSIALVVALWAGSFVDERVAEAASLPPNLRTVLGRFARAVLVLLAVLTGLSLSGIDLTVLSVFGGALGVGLGLGLQRIASNYVSGFILLLDRGLRIGDFISVDQHTGVVEEIRTRYTLLRSLDGSEAIVPNEVLVSSTVVNYTLGNRCVMLAVRVAVSQDTDLDLVRTLLLQAARAPRILQDPAPVVNLIDFQASLLVFELDFYIGDPENGRANAQSDVAIAVVRSLRAHGIALAAPVTELRGLSRAESLPSPIPANPESPR